MSDTNESPRPLPGETELFQCLRQSTMQTLALDKLDFPADFRHEQAIENRQALASEFRPVIVCPGENGHYRIIDGARRVMVKKENGESQCLCQVFIIQPHNMPCAMLFRILLNRARPLSACEQIEFVRFCKSDSAIIPSDEIFRLTRINPKSLDLIDALLRGDADSIESVKAQRIHLENAGSFALLDREARKAFSAFFNTLGLSVSCEREFLDWLPEIAQRDGTTVVKILESASLLAIRNNETLTPPQTIQKLRESLYQTRFPRYDASRKTWDQLVRKTFGQHKEITLTPSPFFEKDRLELRMVVTSAHQAAKLSAHCATISEETWSSLIYPMK